MGTNEKRLRLTIVFITAIALLSMGFKLTSFNKKSEGFITDQTFEVEYNFYAKAKDKKLFIKSYLPQSTERQRIELKNNFTDGMRFKVVQEEQNERGVWRESDSNKFKSISYTFEFKGKAIEFLIDNGLENEQEISSDMEKYLIEEEHIQVNDPKIKAKAQSLFDEERDLKQNIESIYNFVYEIPSVPIRNLTSATTALEQLQASCNGKSRLFVALCRNVGIPARLKGGMILEETEKRTSHLWTEVLVQNQWVPFDVLNGHFASLPANYLEIYTGDRFLLTHTPEILFDYNYIIKKTTGIPLLNVEYGSDLSKNPLTLIPFIEHKIISQEMLFLLMLLPLAGLIIAICKNVIGFKTYGIFLPVLIAHAFSETGFATGFLIMLLFSGMVVLFTLPLAKWGILHTPKIVIVLSISIFFFLLILLFSEMYNIQWLEGLSFFPIIIMAILAERLARSIEEDGVPKASNLFLQTLCVTTLCFFIFNSEFIKSLVLVFPEIILIVIAITLMLGKWIGVRMTELNRFKSIIEA